MDTTLQGVYVDIPQSDMRFFEELVRKMGWNMRLPFVKAKEESWDNVVDKLYGAIRLPENFDYKAEVEQAILERYL